MGIDRDEDGVYDRDELDAGTDPANPGAVTIGMVRPLGPGRPDLAAKAATRAGLDFGFALRRFSLRN